MNTESRNFRKPLISIDIGNFELPEFRWEDHRQGFLKGIFSSCLIFSIGNLFEEVKAVVTEKRQLKLAEIEKKHFLVVSDHHDCDARRQKSQIGSLFLDPRFLLEALIENIKLVVQRNCDYIGREKNP